MNQTIRFFMLVEAASFSIASLVHSGVFITGYEHPQARIAEGVIAFVLFVGLTISIILQDWTRVVGLTAQSFALLGTMVGLFTVAIGVGPRTIPDLIYHISILIILVWGLFYTARARSTAAS